VRTLLSLATVIALTACLAGEAAAPRIGVSKPPRGLRVGQEWLARVSVRGARPARFVVSSGRRVAGFPLTSAGNRYSASIRFPAAGRWRYGVRVGRRDRFVGSVLVRPAVPALQQPHGIVEETDGKLLVADFRSNAVFRLDPSTGEGSTVVRIPGPRDIRRAGDGKLLVSSGLSVLELDAVARRTRLLARAAGPLEGIAPASDGSIYVAEDQSRIVRLRRDGSRAVLAQGLNGVHGILATADGVVVCESFAGNVLLVSESGRRTLASGLGNPSYAAEAPNGGLYVTEFSANRVSLLEPSGRVQAIAAVPSPGPVVVDRAGRLLVGSLAGEIHRVDPGTKRVTRIWPRR
jgi:streptogramin lyase